ncbi:MAG: hypothetical protein V3T77_02885, partial [Planctomycetota bacterium]
MAPWLVTSAMRTHGPGLGILVLVVLCSCAGRPILWQRWDLPAPGVDSPLRLYTRMQALEERLHRDHLSPEGLLLYRIPSEPHPEAGTRLDLADQACWSGYLLAALSFQYACEPSRELLHTIRRVCRGLGLLHDVTGTPGLLARCVLPVELAPLVQHHPEDWHSSTTHPELAWRGDVSKDQYSGYVFGWCAALLLIQDTEVQATGQRVLRDVAHHLEAGGLRIRDGAGRVTTFGDLRGRIYGVPIGVNSVLSLAMLRSAAQFAPDSVLAATVGWRTPELLATLEPLHFELFGIRNYNNDLMAAVGLATLALLPNSVDLRRPLRKVLRGFLSAFRGEGNAFFVSLAALYGIRDPEQERHAYLNL